MATQSVPHQRRVVVTGLGFITSIGNNREQVLSSLRERRTGIEYFSPLERTGVNVRLAGTVKEFEFPELRSDEWIYPGEYKIERTQLRSLAPNGRLCLLRDGAGDQGCAAPTGRRFEPADGAMCASNGSGWLTYEYLDMMLEKGRSAVNRWRWWRASPGTLNMNLVACFRIKGHSLGFSSACASSRMRWARRSIGSAGSAGHHVRRRRRRL
jgi:3-oxoacyl-[acyl-carrier-protein] synthase-1